MLGTIVQKHYSNDFLNFSSLLQALLIDHQITESPFHFFSNSTAKTNNAQQVSYGHCRILEYPFLLALFHGRNLSTGNKKINAHHQMLLTSCPQMADQLRFYSTELPIEMIDRMVRVGNTIDPYKYLLLDLPDDIVKLNMMNPRGRSALAFILNIIAAFHGGNSSTDLLAVTRSKQEQIFRELSNYLTSEIDIFRSPDEPWLEFYFDSGLFGNHILLKKEIYSLHMGVSLNVEKIIQLPMNLERFSCDHEEGEHNLHGLRDLTDLLLEDLRFRMLDA